MNRRTTCASLALLCLILTLSAASNMTTVRNDAYKFEITAPQSWRVAKSVQPDPDDKKSSGGSFKLGSQAPTPPDWNAVTFGAGSGAPAPLVMVMAHHKSGQTAEQFAKNFEAQIASMGGKILSANRNFSIGSAKGIDYTYVLGLKTRYVVVYDGGNRYIMTYMFPDPNPALFDQHAAEADAVFRSLRTK